MESRKNSSLLLPLLLKPLSSQTGKEDTSSTLLSSSCGPTVPSPEDSPLKKLDLPWLRRRFQKFEPPKIDHLVECKLNEETKKRDAGFCSEQKSIPSPDPSSSSSGRTFLMTLPWLKRHCSNLLQQVSPPLGTKLPVYPLSDVSPSLPALDLVRLHPHSASPSHQATQGSFFDRRSVRLLSKKKSSERMLALSACYKSPQTQLTAEVSIRENQTIPEIEREEIKPEGMALVTLP